MRLPVAGGAHTVEARIAGEGERVLLALHGGPGLSTDYLEPLARLAGDDLRVVLYDQLGGGRSDRPDDPGLWTLPRFVEEVDEVRRGLGVEAVDLYGSSWGGFLALQYALDHPDRVRSLVLSNTAASVPQVVAEMADLRRAALDDATFAWMLRCEALGELRDPRYREALLLLNARHILRSCPYEPRRSAARYRAVAEPLFADVGPPFAALWGPHGWLCTGSLLDFDVTARLGEIAVPTLVTCGLHDQLTVACHATIAEGMPQARLVVFGASSHLPMLEAEAEEYLAAIGAFLRRLDA